MSGHEDRSRLRALWISIGAFVLVAVLLLGWIARGTSRARFFSPPDQIRPWAENTYRQRFDPSLHQPLPTLSDEATPVLTIGQTGRTTEITGKASSRGGSQDMLFEIFPADSSGMVTLPDGNRLELAAIAFMLPSDVDRKEGNPSYPSLRPEWLDPRTGEPIADAPGNEWTRREHPAPHRGPRLFLRVRRTGSQAPLRWHWPYVHDDRTLDQIGSASSHSTDRTDGEFWVDFCQWHQAPVRIAIQFGFGDPEEVILPVKKGALAEFGDAGRAELVEIIPGGHNSSSWGGGGGDFRAAFTAPTLPPASTVRSLIFQVWPRQNHYLTEALPLRGERGQVLTGNGGIAAVLERGADASASEIRIRHFPRLGRAVFELAAVPRLPVVESLFETPIPYVRIEYPHEYLRTATEAAGVKWRMRSLDLPDSLFPMELTGTTPAAMLGEYERLAGKRLYFDRAALFLTDEPPPGMFDELREWWRRHRPGWWR